MDLPFSPSRIEQRIGRLDRFGRFKHVEQWIILPYLSEKNENLWLIWFEVLKNGFCIFNESISDVQLSLEPIMEKLKLSLINGPNELKESVNYVKEYILEERKYIDAQYTLDRVIQEEESAKNLFDDVDQFEEDEIEIADAIYGWLRKCLQFKINGNPNKHFQFIWDFENTLLPPDPSIRVTQIILIIEETS